MGVKTKQDINDIEDIMNFIGFDIGIDYYDENFKEQMKNNLDFKHALESEEGLAWIKQSKKTLKSLKLKINKIPNEKLDENKSLKDYDYYDSIYKEFLIIYKTINYDEIISLFSKDAKLNLQELIDKFKERNLNKDEKNEIGYELINHLGIAEGIDLNNFNPKEIANKLLINGILRLIKEPSLNKKSTKLYITSIDNMVKEIEEYNYISKKLSDIKDPHLNNFIVQLLYLKAYEGNLTALREAYKNETGKSQKSYGNKLKEYYKDFDEFKLRHEILAEAMNNKLRDGIAHNSYKVLKKYNSDEILELARRNFITNIISVIVKTNSIIELYDNAVRYISPYLL